MKPGVERVHFCLAQPGASNFDAAAPVTQGIGADCPRGLAYQQLLVPLAVSPGHYAIKVVPAESEDCSVPALAELPEVSVAEGETLTVLRMAGREVSSHEGIGAFPETAVPSLNMSLLRFVNAVGGMGDADLGFTDGARWPCTIKAVAFREVPFGSVAAPGKGDVAQIDANGYIDFFTTGGRINLGVAPTGNPVPAALGAVRMPSGGAATLIAVGSQGNPGWPPQLLACNDGASRGYLTDCASEPTDVSVMVWEPVLDGAADQGIHLRRPFVPGAVANADADVLCLANVCAIEDKIAIIDAARGRFPHAYYQVQDLGSKVDDPTDIHGQVPPLPTEPSCEGDDIIKMVRATMDCIAQHCATTPGDADSPVTSMVCMVDHCLPASAGLLFGPDCRYKGCFSCLMSGLISFEPISLSEKLCTTVPGETLGYQGDNCQLLLSRYPLGKGKTWTVSSTTYRTAFSVAPVLLPNDESLDVYCTTLTTAGRANATWPYCGPYGEGSDANPWSNENRLQLEKLARFAKDMSGPNPAVLLGAFYVGPGLKVGDSTLLAGVAPESFSFMQQQFGLGVASDWAWQCTECHDNPWLRTPEGSSKWTSHLFTSGIPLTDLLSTMRTFEEGVVPLPDDAGMGPASTRFGIRTVIRVHR